MYHVSQIHTTITHVGVVNHVGGYTTPHKSLYGGCQGLNLDIRWVGSLLHKMFTIIIVFCVTDVLIFPMIHLVNKLTKTIMNEGNLDEIHIN